MIQTAENNTVKEILSIIEDMPKKFQSELLRQLKLKKALQLAKKIDSSKGSKIKYSDQEIADMVHNFRIGKR
ncbi:MAG: hypothetical protein ABI723_07615 [Bacteroidia bacterium]